MITSTRRHALIGGLTSALFLGRSGPQAHAGTSAPRLVVVNILGGVDGLSMIVPYGDASLKSLRAPLIPAGVNTAGGMRDLGGFYGLHPAMPNFYGMYAAGQALAVHAVGNCGITSGLQSSRSHFSGQDYIQSGAPQLLSSGWLNRAAAFIPAAGLQSAMPLGSLMPLLLQGPATVAGWMPGLLGGEGSDTILSNAILAASRADPLLGPAHRAAAQDYAAITAIAQAAPAAPGGLSALGLLAYEAGVALAAPNGPRIACFTTSNFDTHVNQAALLKSDLNDLDQAFAVLKSSLGPAWANTVVVTITEFGRTAAVNGTGGTDHGTAFAMLLAGGAVKGGRVVATWPGLTGGQLYQRRDLAPTVDVRSVLMGILAGHMGLSAANLASVFPNATGISPMSGLAA